MAKIFKHDEYLLDTSKKFEWSVQVQSLLTFTKNITHYNLNSITTNAYEKYNSLQPKVNNFSSLINFINMILFRIYSPNSNKITRKWKLCVCMYIYILPFQV